MEAVFIFERNELIRYVVPEKAEDFQVKRFSLENPDMLEEHLFDDHKQINNFSVYLSRNVVLEDECETGISPSSNLEESIKKKLADNPLFDAKKHMFVYLSDKGQEKRKGSNARLINIFYFEKYWIMLIEKLFIHKGLLPLKIGILTTLVQDDYLLKTNETYVYVKWIHDLEINLISYKELVYSRHIPVMEENADEILKEIISSIRKLKKYYTELKNTVILLSPPHHVQGLRKSLEKESFDYIFHSIANDSIAKNLPISFWKDKFIISVCSLVKNNRNPIDLSHKVKISLDKKNKYSQWIKAAAAVFFIIGLAGFLTMNVARKKLQENAYTVFAKYLPLEAKTWSVDDILISMNDIFTQRQAYAEKPSSLIFNNLIYCLPRDAKWELVSFIKDENIYYVRMAFKTQIHAQSFLKAVFKIDEWTYLRKRNEPANEVELKFKVENE